MKKDIEWLKKEVGTEMIRLEPNRAERWSDVKYQTLRSVAQKINQLDEPEVLSQEESINIVLDDLKEYIKEQQSLSQNVGLAHTTAGNDTHYRQYDYVLECVNEYEPSDDLQSLIIPKPKVLSQEWIDEYAQGDCDEWLYTEDLQNLLVPKQELPVIPEYVADWIKEEQGTMSNWKLPSRFISDSKYKKDQRRYKWSQVEGNMDKFMSALINGYEVEEEQKYNVKIEGNSSSGTVGIFLYKQGDEVLAGDNFEAYHPEKDKFRLTEKEIKDFDERYWTFRELVD